MKHLDAPRLLIKRKFTWLLVKSPSVLFEVTRKLMVTTAPNFSELQATREAARRHFELPW